MAGAGDGEVEIAVLGSFKPRKLHREFHRLGVHLPLWNTGGTHGIAVEPPVSEADAPNFAARFFLMGIYNRFDASYFDHWGGRRVPLVLQVEGAQPTRAARHVDLRRQWPARAKPHSCGNGIAAGLPDGVWQCRGTRCSYR